jgi:hypothetical protein
MRCLSRPVAHDVDDPELAVFAGHTNEQLLTGHKMAQTALREADQAEVTADAAES